jgi:hypothetical protein
MTPTLVSVEIPSFGPLTTTRSTTAQSDAVRRSPLLTGGSVRGRAADPLRSLKLPIASPSVRLAGMVSAGVCGLGLPWPAVSRQLSARNVGWIEQSRAAPTHREQPCPGSRDGRLPYRSGFDLARTRYRALPAVEPTRRRRRIESHMRLHGCLRLGGMPPRVQEHVTERVMNLARRREQS